MTILRTLLALSALTLTLRPATLRAQTDGTAPAGHPQTANGTRDPGEQSPALTEAAPLATNPSLARSTTSSPATEPPPPAPASLQGQPSPQARPSAASPSHARATKGTPEAPGFQGFTIPPQVEGYSIKLGGLVQADSRFFASGGDGLDTFVVRRARLDLRATLGRYFGFRLQPELAGSSVTLLDAYGQVAPIDELQLQIGKMKSPLGLEVLQSPRDTLFTELGLPGLLVPNRDVGVMLKGSLFARTAEYALGVFNGVADGANGDVDDGNDKELEGRLFLKPLLHAGLPALAGLGAGLSGSLGKQGGALPSYKTPGRQTFFSYAEGVKAAGAHGRLSPQGYYFYGPVGVLAELVRSTQEVSDGVSTARVASSAWQVWGSLVLGGSPSYTGTKVKAAFDPGSNTWGALELGLRYGELQSGRRAFKRQWASSQKSARRARNFGAALSWWLLTGTRAQVAFDHTAFDGGDVNADRQTENVLVARLQVAL